MLTNFGDACDDNNGNTSNDVINADCECEGTPNLDPIEICSRIATSTDDAEQKYSGYMRLDDKNFQLVDAGDLEPQTIGLRFINLNIPPGAIVSNAFIQFKSKGVSSGVSSLTIWGQDATLDPSTFNPISGDISNRSKTTTSINWTPNDWSSPNEVGPDQQTVDIAGIIQEIVNSSTYVSGHSIVIIIEGIGTRSADSFDRNPLNAPELCITYNEIELSVMNRNEDEKIPSLKQVELDNLSIYPNPAKDQITLVFDRELMTRQAELLIMDINGRLMYSEKRMIDKLEDELQIENLDLPSGIYYVHLIRGPHFNVSKFLIAK